jgi:hypothetical protein
VFELQNNIGSATNRHGSVANNYRGVTWQSVADPRVSVSATNNGFGSDGITPFFSHNKALARGDGQAIATYKEAQLIVAEAAARTGDLATARDIIRARHTAAGIPGYDANNTATQNEIIAQVIEERSREMFLEEGHRLNDMLRFRTTAFEIPFRGEAGSIHPNGVDHRGLVYGPTTCIPLPLAKRADARVFQDATDGVPVFGARDADRSPSFPWPRRATRHRQAQRMLAFAFRRLPTAVRCRHRGGSPSRTTPSSSWATRCWWST